MKLSPKQYLIGRIIYRTILSVMIGASICTIAWWAHVVGIIATVLVMRSMMRQDMIERLVLQELRHSREKELLLKETTTALQDAERMVAKLIEKRGNVPVDVPPPIGKLWS